MVKRCAIVAVLVAGLVLEVGGQQLPPPGPLPVYPPLPATPAPRGVPLPEPKPLEPSRVQPRDEGEVGPRVPADYAARALLAVDPVFVNRITSALLVVSDDVLIEAPPVGAGPEAEAYLARMAVVSEVMREPEFAGRKMARLVSGKVPATMSVGGDRPSTSATDAELKTVIASRFTALGVALKQR